MYHGRRMLVVQGFTQVPIPDYTALGKEQTTFRNLHTRLYEADDLASPLPTTTNRSLGCLSLPNMVTVFPYLAMAK